VEKVELKMSERSHRSVCDGQAWSFPEAILFVAFVCFVGNSDYIVPALGISRPTDQSLISTALLELITFARWCA
jgi:hypothetical protein